jgi:hypothetical protein
MTVYGRIAKNLRHQFKLVNTLFHLLQNIAELVRPSWEKRVLAFKQID